jgi:hypothetical protein
LQTTPSQSHFAAPRRAPRVKDHVADAAELSDSGKALMNDLVWTAMSPNNQSLKKIPIGQLRLGVFIQELCGSWLHHPFLTTRFKLTKPRDLGALHPSDLIRT